nr:DUF397 domain-containing protein [Actinomadura sp. NBRC 104425]
MRTTMALRSSWRKSSYSDEEFNCVEAASLTTGIAVRDSKDPDGPKLVLGSAAWRALSTDIKAGRYDLRRSS